MNLVFKEKYHTPYWSAHYGKPPAGKKTSGKLPTTFNTALSVTGTQHS